MKTTEDEAKEQANALKIYSSKQDFEKGFKAGVEFSQRWIPIEEESPPIENKKNCENFSIDVFLKSNNNEVSVGYYAFMSGKFVVKDRDLKYMEVAYWRPIELK